MSGTARFLLFSALAGTSALAAFVAKRKQHPGRRLLKVGEHAWLVPAIQAKREADWTRRAFTHASESHHKG